LEEKMLTQIAQKTSGLIIDKGSQLIHEFNETIPKMRALGLSVSDMSLKMGIPPEIGATFTGAVDAFDQGKLKEMIADEEGRQVMTLMLEALIAVSNVKDQLSELEIHGVKMAVRLGLSPNVEVGLLT
jgi:hypothetical protein